MEGTVGDSSLATPRHAAPNSIFPPITEENVMYFTSVAICTRGFFLLSDSLVPPRLIDEGFRMNDNVCVSPAQGDENMISIYHVQ